MAANRYENSIAFPGNRRRLSAAVAILCSAGAFGFKVTNDHARVHLAPHFVVGQVMDYQIEMRNVTKGRATGVVQDPEAASVLSQSTSLLVRLEVLNMEGANVRIRATCRHAEVANQSDAYDEQAEAMAEQYRKLEGRSLEFGLDADGHVSEVTGLEGVVQDPAALASVRGWLANISAGARFPKNGIIVGEKWHSEEPVPGAPLRATVWRADSTYLRNEACRNAKEPTPNAPAASSSLRAGSSSESDGEMCAVILTQFKILQANPHGDLTPADYLHNGLRTSGTWTGSGESLNSVSLETGFVVSAAQTAEQDLNFTITSASSSSRLNYTGNVKSQSEITLLPYPNKD